MDTLQVDLNEIVSKEIQQKLRAYKRKIVSLKEQNATLQNEITELRNKDEDYNTSLRLLDVLREAFSKISSTKQTENKWERSKGQNQFEFIENVLSNIFNIKKEANGWYGSSYGNLQTHLAVNYYSNRETVTSLLRIIKADSGKEISFISNFIMPFDYNKEEVIAYVKGPNYNTNGCIYGINQYWIEHGAGKTNMPHDLIMQSPFILQEDVFSEMINTIQKCKSEFHWLFALPKYNKNISVEQIQRMGECLITLNKKFLNYDEVKSFISDNLKDLNNKTLDFLYTLIQSDNEYRALHWEKFPNEYQGRFLKSMSLDAILKIFTGYNCSWTIEQKELFLKEYLADAGK